MTDAPLDADAAALRARWIAAGLPPLESMTPVAARDLMRRSRAAPAEVEEVATVTDFAVAGVGGAIGCRLYHPDPSASALPCLLFLHGGGWVLNDLESHDPLCRALAARSGWAVIAVDYRLAPEAPFPAALDDALTALDAVRDRACELRIDPTRVVVGGDSAGGNLAAVLALIARDRGWEWIRGQVLLYPAVDLTCDHPSYTLQAPGLAVTGATMRWFRDLYLGIDRAAAKGWRASPLLARSLTGVAPCVIVTAGWDPLVDEGLAYAQRLAAEGVRVLHDHQPGQMHGFVSAGLAFATARRVVNLVSLWLQAT